MRRRARGKEKKRRKIAKIPRSPLLTTVSMKRPCAIFFEVDYSNFMLSKNFILFIFFKR